MWFLYPGMIISAKVLIDENNDPTPDDVKGYLGNICRCTGYVKSEEGIMLAAKMFVRAYQFLKRIQLVMWVLVYTV